jgi:hypothetical protein
MANSRDPVVARVYFDDNGTGWRVDLTQAVADAGKFNTTATNQSYLPKHAKMRHVGCKESNGKRHQVPMSNAAGVYLNGGTLTLDGKQMTVTGRIGEKFRLSGS